MKQLTYYIGYIAFTQDLCTISLDFTAYDYIMLALLVFRLRDVPDSKFSGYRGYQAIAI